MNGVTKLPTYIYKYINSIIISRYMQITLQEHGTLYETKCNRSTENIINGVISRGSGTGRIRKQQSSGASAHPRSITCATAVRTHKRVNGKCHYLVRRLDYTHFGLCNISKFIHNYFHELRQFSKNIFICTGK